MFLTPIISLEKSSYIIFQIHMNTKPINPLLYQESFRERASYAYLMQLLIFMIALPLPLINLLGGITFWFFTRKNALFVKWHAIQALISQIWLYLVNACMMGWTFMILFNDTPLSSLYFSTLFTLIIFNLVDYVYTIITAIKVRKGIHYKWWIYGYLTDKICGRYEEVSA